MPSPRPAPVVTRRPDPAAWRRALELAEGDVGRLEVLHDGSVLVSNSARRPGPTTRR